MKRLTTLLLVAALAAPFASIALPDLNYSTFDIDYSTDEDLSWSFAVVDGEAIITGVSPKVDDWYPYNGFISVPEQVTGWESGQTYTVVGVESIAGVPQYFTSEQMENLHVSLPATIRFIYDWVFQDFYSPQVHIVDNGPQLEYIGEETFRQNSTVMLTDYWPGDDGSATNVPWFLGGVVRNAWNPPAFLDLSSYRGVAAGSLRDFQYLRNIILPTTINILPHHLFTGCSGLRDIVIPATVTNIEACVFANCSSLTNITFEGNAPVVASPFDQWDDGHSVGVFDGVNSNCVVIVQRGTTGWGEVPGTWQGMPIRYAGEEPPPALTGEYRDGNINWRFTVNADGSATIDSASAMVSLIYFNSENEGDYYFCWDGTIPSRVSDGVGEVNATWYPVTAIGDYALSGLAYDVGFPNGMSVFTITVPDAVTCIGDYAFQGISYATDIDLPEGLEYMGRNVFDGCNYITNGNSWDPDYAVQDLLAFEGWVVGPWWSCSTEGVERSAPESADLSAAKGIAAGAFSNCMSLRNVVLPVNAGVLPQSAFYGTSLTESLIPASVTNIEADVFANCSSLTNITFAGNAPTSVDATAFQDVNSNCVVTVQRGTTGWGEVPGTWQGMPTRYADEEPPPAPVVIDLSTLAGDYTASDGDILTNSTTHVVTIPAGATVTINGVTVAGGAGSGAAGPAVFADGGEAITTRIAPGANGTWMLTAFAELASGSAEGLDDAQVKVYAANTLAGLASAQPMASGVVVTNKAPAVKVELEVTLPANADAQFFRVGFGE